MTHANDLTLAAASYLDRGLRVIALSGKAPNGQVHPHWRDDAIAYEAGPGVLHAAFHHPATTGIGILTGYPYYVVDIDGEEGAAAWKEIAGDDFIPDRWVAQTGRRDEKGHPNGLHVWVAHWTHFPPGKLAEKLDFKGDGGYVAAPPSIHPDSGEPYVWLAEPGDNIPLEMPDGLLNMLSRRKAEAEARLVNKQTYQTRIAQRHEPGMFFASQTSFDGIIQRMVDEPPGNRNGVLYWAARTMIEEGAGDEDLEVLFDAAIGAGLGRQESRRTIRSAIEATRG